jgi:predicted enzyme related to lactoylglutathione lyase
MPAHLSSKLVIYDVPSKDLAKSRAFYGALFGSNDFAPSPSPASPSLFHPIAPDGLDITIHEMRDMDPREIPVSYFAVDDLGASIKQLEALGGKLKHGPVDVPLPAGKALQAYQGAAKAARQTVGERVGRAAVMLDPDSNPIGLMQLEHYAAYYFRAGSFQASLRADQVEGLKQAHAAHG